MLFFACINFIINGLPFRAYLFADDLKLISMFPLSGQTTSRN